MKPEINCGGSCLKKLKRNWEEGTVKELERNLRGLNLIKNSFDCELSQTTKT